MIIYLIEDNPQKAQRICELFDGGKERVEIQVFGSFQTGLKAIEKETPDIVLLDMNLPTFDRGPNVREGRNRPLGGYDLMRKLKLRKIFPKVIIITQLESFGEGEDEMSFEEMTSLCEQEFPSMFVGSIYFSSSDNDWQDKLTKLIDIKNA